MNRLLLVKIIAALLLAGCMHKGHHVSQEETEGAVSKSRLEFKFSGDCWVQLDDEKDSLTLMAGLQTEGSSLFFELPQDRRYRIMVGATGNTIMRFNGENVPLPGENTYKVFYVGPAP